MTKITMNEFAQVSRDFAKCLIQLDSINSVAEVLIDNGGLMTIPEIAETLDEEYSNSRIQAALYKLMALNAVERIEKIPTTVRKTIIFDDGTERVERTSVRSGSKSDAIIFFRLKK